MPNAISHLESIYNNPFVFSSIIYHFFSNIALKDKNILLSYLVLPLVLYPETQKFLKNSNIRSSIFTMTSNRKNIYGLEERIIQYGDITNMCIQHNIDNNIFSIQTNLSVVVNNGKSVKTYNANHVKAAQKLGKLLSPYDVVTCYRTLGVKRI